jgi:hypothetical protein
MITAIFMNEKATLTIETSEALILEQLVQEGAPIEIELSSGTNRVPIGPGVFRMLSKSAPRVTADTPNLYVAYTTTNNKDTGFPDPPKSPEVSPDSDAIKHFFSARSQSAPR